jgi:hypothetical protein
MTVIRQDDRGFTHTSSNGLFDDSVVPSMQVSATSYTLSADDFGQVRAFTSASPVTVTVPKNLGIQFQCVLVQLGAGQVTVSPASGVTVSNRLSQSKTAGQYAAISLLAVGVDQFVLCGDAA